MEKLKAQVSALETELHTLKGKKQMNWLKRKIEQFMSTMPESNYNSPLETIFSVTFGGII